MKAFSKGKIQRMIDKKTIAYARELDKMEGGKKKERKEKEAKERIEITEWLKSQQSGRKKKKTVLDTGSETLEAEDIKDGTGEST